MVDDPKTGFKGESSQSDSSQVGAILMKHVSDLVQQSTALKTAGSSFNTLVCNEEQALVQRALSLEEELKSLRSKVFDGINKDQIPSCVAGKVLVEIERAQWMISKGEYVGVPCTNHYNGDLFLKMLLGSINVKATRYDARLRVKEDYHSFRDKTTIISLIFTIILLLLVWKGCLSVVPARLHQVWLLYLYSSLALRENILKINGSDIRPWWLYHHYCAMLMAMVALTWDFDGQHPFYGNFLVWSMMQGFAMLLQNLYERQRLYTQIALGKAGRMDVCGETSGVVVQFWPLYPISVGIQCVQGFLGLFLLSTAIRRKDFEWQAIACGILLLIMALGNFLNTWKTWLSKRGSM